MNYRFKKIIFTVLLNFTIFMILIIGIQNSTKKSKVNFLLGETINLPISFIIGVSFITGSITSSILGTKLWKN